MGELVRFGVSLERGLLDAFDMHSARKGFANRSEALLHCIRRELSEELSAEPDAPIAGVLTLVYDHHDNDLPRRLVSLQHEAHSLVLSTMHVHLDEHHCLEAMALRGPASAVRQLADRLRSARGILQSSCALTSIETVPLSHGTPYTHKEAL